MSITDNKDTNAIYWQYEGDPLPLDFLKSDKWKLLPKDNDANAVFRVNCNFDVKVSGIKHDKHNYLKVQLTEIPEKFVPEEMHVSVREEIEKKLREHDGRQFNMEFECICSEHQDTVHFMRISKSQLEMIAEHHIPPEEAQCHAIPGAPKNQTLKAKIHHAWFVSSMMSYILQYYYAVCPGFEMTIYDKTKLYTDTNH